jgi:hypothetical protein
MRGVKSNIMPRRQAVERKALAPIVGAVNGSDAQAEPWFSEGLCQAITAFWRARGVTVRAWVEYQRANNNDPGARSLHVIRSMGIPGGVMSSYLDLDLDERGRLIERQGKGWRAPETLAQRERDKPLARERVRRTSEAARATRRIVANLKAGKAADAARALDPLSRAHDAFAAARDAFFAAIEQFGEADARTERAGDEMMRLRAAFLRAWGAKDAP